MKRDDGGEMKHSEASGFTITERRNKPEWVNTNRTSQMGPAASLNKPKKRHSWLIIMFISLHLFHFSSVLQCFSVIYSQILSSLLLSVSPCVCPSPVFAINYQDCGALRSSNLSCHGFITIGRPVNRQKHPVFIVLSRHPDFGIKPDLSVYLPFGCTWEHNACVFTEQSQ